MARVISALHMRWARLGAKPWIEFVKAAHATKAAKAARDELPITNNSPLHRTYKSGY